MITTPRRRSAKRPVPRIVPFSAFPLVIGEERRRREWTQREMAEFVGVSQSLIARWEAGTRRPSTPELTRLGHLLNIAWQLS